MLVKTMGSPMAPIYASLFMGKLEKELLEGRYILPSVWLRFLDDIFMVWNHSLESLHSFIDALNCFHPSDCLQEKNKESGMMIWESWTPGLPLVSNPAI